MVPETSCVREVNISNFSDFLCVKERDILPPDQVRGYDRSGYILPQADEDVCLKETEAQASLRFRNW